MRKNGKRVLAILLAASVAASLAGCGKGGSKGGAYKTDLKNTTYEMVDLDSSAVKGDVSYIRNEGGLVVFASEESEDLTKYPDDWVDGMPPENAADDVWDTVEFNYKYTSHVYSMKEDGSDIKALFDIDYADNSGASLCQMALDEKQNIYCVTSAYNESTENYDYEMKIYDLTGKQTGGFSMVDFFDPADYSYIQAMCIGNDGYIYLNCESFLLVIDKDAKEICRIKVENYIGNMVRDKDKNVVVSTYENDGEVLKKVDAAKKGFGQSVKLSTSVTNMTDGMGDFDFYDMTSNGIDGLKADGSRTNLLNWVGSNINGQNIMRVTPLSNGDFVAYYYDYNAPEGGDEGGMKLLKKVDPSQVKDKVAINFGGIWISDEVKAAAIRFNKAQNDYQVVIRDYGNEEDPVSMMNADILAGDMPDILDLGSLDADKFISKGMVTDLYPLMEKDGEIKKDDFIDSIMKAMETDGKLYYIAPRFSINILVGSQADLGDKTHVSVKEVMELEKKTGARAFSDTNSNASVLANFCQQNYERFADWNTGKCSFDSQEFIDILEYANTYQNEDDINYEDSQDTVDAIREHKQLFAELWSMSYLDVEMYDKLFENKAVYIGYPSEEEGIGFTPQMMLAISSKAKNPDAAWQFVKTLLTEEAISKSDEDMLWYDGFPTRKDSLEEEIKRFSATSKYTDVFGVEHEPVDAEWGMGDNLSVKMKPMTKEQSDLVRQIIDRVDHRQVYDNEIDNIISEETGALFSGQKSAKDVAGIIQNRVTTYVNENR